MAPVRSDEGYVTGHAPIPRRYKLSYLAHGLDAAPRGRAPPPRGLPRRRSSATTCWRRRTMEGALAEQPLPALVTVALPLGPDRSIADIWSALGGEMKPSLDVVVTVPFVVEPRGGGRRAGPRDAADLGRRTRTARTADRIARGAASRRGPAGARTGPLRPDEPIVQDETVVGGTPEKPGPRLPGARPPASLTAMILAAPDRRLRPPPRRPPGPRRRPRPASPWSGGGAAIPTPTTGSAASTSPTPRSTTCSAAATGRSSGPTTTAAAAERAARRSRPRPTPRRRPAPRSGCAASPARFDLEPLDVELLLVALAPDLDPRFERLYGYLHDDVSRRRASVGLALELSGVGEGSGPGRARLGPLAPLVAGGLLVVEDADRPFLTRALRVPDRVAAHLLGDATPDPAVEALATVRRRPRRGRHRRPRGRPPRRRPPGLRPRADRHRGGDAGRPGARARRAAAGRRRPRAARAGRRSARGGRGRDPGGAAARHGPRGRPARRRRGARAGGRPRLGRGGLPGRPPRLARLGPGLVAVGAVRPRRGPPVRRGAAGRLAGLARRDRLGGAGGGRGRAPLPPRARGRRPRRRGRPARRGGGRAGPRRGRRRRGRPGPERGRPGAPGPARRAARHLGRPRPARRRRASSSAS